VRKQKLLGSSWSPIVRDGLAPDLALNLIVRRRCASGISLLFFRQLWLLRWLHGRKSLALNSVMVEIDCNVRLGDIYFLSKPSPGILQAGLQLLCKFVFWPQWSISHLTHDCYCLAPAESQPLSLNVCTKPVNERDQHPNNNHETHLGICVTRFEGQYRVPATREFLVTYGGRS